MKVRIDKAALTVPLYRAQGVISRKPMNNVLAHVHIAASADGLVFTAAEYDVTVVAEVAADVIEPGAAVVNGRSLFDIVRALPDGATVQLSTEANNRLRIEAGRAYYYLNGMAPEEFPPNAIEDTQGRGLLCDKSHLETMLKRTLFSVSQEENRPALNGVLLEIEPEGNGAPANQVRIRMVSTDGTRLSKAERSMTVSDYDGQKHQWILHHRGASELQRIFEGADPSARIEFVGRNVVISSDKARVQVRQIEERFPDYTRVIPERGDASVTLTTSEFMSAVRRVSSLASARGDSPLRVELEAGRMVLEMSHNDGEAHEEIDLPDYQGAKIKVGFNPRFLLDVCNVLGTEHITLELSDQFSPCLLHADEEPGCVFVIMPMRM